MTYKVSTKGGRVYRANSIEHKPGFLQMNCWDGEHRIPAGEVTYIKSTEVDEIPRVMLPLFIVCFLLFFAVMVWLFAPY